MMRRWLAGLALGAVALAMAADPTPGAAGEALALSAAPPAGPRSPEPGAQAGEEPAPGPSLPILRRALAALEDEDVAAARQLVEPLLRERPDDRAVLAVAGMVRFHEQRYAEAVELLEKAAVPTGSIDYLSLARATRDVTRGHVRAEGEHFAVSYPKGKDEVLVPYVLDALERQRRALEQDLGWAAPGRITVEILNDTRELARVSTLTEQEIKTSGTIALCKFGKLMIVSPKALVKGYDWLDTAAHEYTHYVVTARTRNNTPIWLHEGIAKYSETRWRGKGGELSSWSARLLEDAVKRGRLVSFSEMHPSMAKLPSQEAAALAFAEVELAVEYLERKGGSALMNRILDLIAGGRSAERAVSEALGVPFDAFLADWKRFLASRPPPPGGAAQHADKLRFKGDPRHGGSHSEWSEIPDERARGFARLGTLLRERGRWVASRVEFGKAVARVGKGIPVLSDQYALAAMMTGRDEEAESALVEALRRHPQYAALHLHLARLHVKRKAWPEAKEHLLSANAVDPFDPEIHAGLAAVADAQGDGALAAREKRFTALLAEGER
jgi:tetratricopeptide (TPR) repeat protein